jgi:hypothetical protein
MDHDTCHAWLARKRWRLVDEYHPNRKLVMRLVLDGRARWVGHCNRAVAVIPPSLPHALIADRDEVCGGCKRTMSVCAADRLEGRWTCYGCGRINRVVSGAR